MAREDRALLEQWDRRVRRRLLLGVGVGGLALTVFALLTAHPEAVGAYLRGEIDLLGRLEYSPPNEPDPQALAAIDLARVHAELLPAWVLAQTRAHTPWGHRRAEEAFTALSGEIAPDANLTDLLGEMRALVRRGQLVEHAHRLYYLCWAWSRYLDRLGQPFWSTGSVIVSGEDATFFVKTYRVLHDLEVRVGEDRHRARVITRLDSLNVVESYLGATSKDHDGAFVLVERVQEFAVDVLWPLLDPRLDARQPPEVQAFLAPLRRETAAQLPADDLAVLVASAGLRREMLDAIEAIGQREQCGSRFAVSGLPWDGIDESEFRTLDGYSELDPLIECPAISVAEAETLIRGSRRLQHTPGLAGAVGALTAWLARGIVIHEARHVADDAQAGGLETPLPCEGCPEGQPAAVRAEISAYLAGLAWSDAPASALLQVCAAADAGPGAHLPALALILGRLGSECADGPGADLLGRARALEQDLFGRSERIALPADFPARLWVP